MLHVVAHDLVQRAFVVQIGPAVLFQQLAGHVRVVDEGAFQTVVIQPAIGGHHSVRIQRHAHIHVVGDLVDVDGVPNGLTHFYTVHGEHLMVHQQALHLPGVVGDGQGADAAFVLGGGYRAGKGRVYPTVFVGGDEFLIAGEK